MPSHRRPSWTVLLWMLGSASLLGCAGEAADPTPEPAPAASPEASGRGPSDPGRTAAPRPGNSAPPAPVARGAPPRNVLRDGAAKEAPLPQPDPGPAPEAPPPHTAGCPDGMVRFEASSGPLCIHAYEVSIQLREKRGGHIRQYMHQPQLLRLVSAPGQVPTPVSFNEARALCRHHGYHLCTSAEWEDACDGAAGDGGAPYPTLRADQYVPGDCNYTHTMKGGTVPLAPTGSYPWCVNPLGAADMLGNIWEWSDPELKDERGQPIIDKRGGSHYGRHIGRCDQPAVGTHKPDWYGSVGFRCCVAPTDAAPAE